MNRHRKQQENATEVAINDMPSNNKIPQDQTLQNLVTNGLLAIEIFQTMSCGVTGLYVGSIILLAQLFQTWFCKSCSQPMHVCGVSQEKTGSAVSISLRCSNNHESTWYSSNNVIDSFKNDAANRMLWAWILYGGTFENYKMFHSLCNMNYFSHDKFYNEERLIGDIVNKLTEENLNSAQEQQKT